jgi:CheY-like chemotaxis protein
MYSHGLHKQAEEIPHPMDFHTANAETLLVTKLQQLHAEQDRWQVATLFFSKLKKESQAKATLQIAYNLIQNEGKDVMGGIYRCRNGNLFILYDYHHQAVIEEIIAKLRHLFVADPLVCAPLYGDSFHALQKLPDVYESLFTHMHSLMAEEAAEISGTPKEDGKVPVDAEAFRRARKNRRNRRPPMVLLAEDHPFSRQLAEQYLNGKKIAHVITADNGVAAIEQYCKHAPDILFLDIDMPVLDGHKVLEEVDKLDADSFVVMLTAKAYQADVLKARTHHARGYIAKPFTPQKIEEYIKLYLDEQQK